MDCSLAQGSILAEANCFIHVLNMGLKSRASHPHCIHRYMRYCKEGRLQISFAVTCNLVWITFRGK